MNCKAADDAHALRRGVQKLDFLATATDLTEEGLKQALAPIAALVERSLGGESEAAAEPAQAQMSFEAYGSGEAFMGTCPDCGSQLEYAEGCVKCHVCGFSECG